ncbi:MAG TPA: HAD-IIIC family phosphatase [Bryobacteraceae bacterium]|jgi:FkbH-like protein|nr:HAD-IIIC family phosphatase [Bryobacteraceae bacterium]
MMTLTEALRQIKRAPVDSQPFRAVLACGFTPLHLSTFLAAHLQRRLPSRAVDVICGLYGDLAGTLRKSAGKNPSAVAVALEWADLDPRLGYRNLGGWGPAEQDDIVRQVKARLGSLRRAIEEVAAAVPVVIAFPTLPLPPVFHTGSWQAGSAQARLNALVQELAAEFSAHASISIVSAQRLDLVSPAGERYDLQSDLFTGFPYKRAHASALGEALANLIAPPPPKKGLVTDLDDTLWSGIVGEVGPQGVHWDLENHAQIHGLYQQTLRALADEGVLIAIASKNDAATVERALARPDMILSPEKIFPVEVHWHAKSGSVARILKAWNIGAGDVVFVDDSPLELAEVEQAFPGIHCLRFRPGDYASAEAFLTGLRDLFARKRISGEDTLRRESLRSASEFQSQIAQNDASQEFLRELNGSIAVNTDAAEDPRSLELVNKTNQFNLNGQRFDPVEWRSLAASPDAFVWSVAYQDKFGSLGKIAVLAGKVRERKVFLESWVMSCRAFARGIENHCLALLYERTGAGEIVFCFRATDRNGPLQDFLSRLLGRAPEPAARLERREFEQRDLPLYHKIQWSQS